MECACLCFISVHVVFFILLGVVFECGVGFVCVVSVFCIAFVIMYQPVWRVRCPFIFSWREKRERERDVHKTSVQPKPKTNETKSHNNTTDLNSITLKVSPRTVAIALPYDLILVPPAVDGRRHNESSKGGDPVKDLPRHAAAIRAGVQTRDRRRRTGGGVVCAAGHYYTPDTGGGLVDGRQWECF